MCSFPLPTPEPSSKNHVSYLTVAKDRVRQLLQPITQEMAHIRVQNRLSNEQINECIERETGEGREGNGRGGEEREAEGRGGKV